jgi:hypothetical protein
MTQEVPGLTIEERLFALEKEVALLKMRLDQLTSPKGNWLDKVAGCMNEIPDDAYREFLECCAEARRQLNRLDDE